METLPALRNTPSEITILLSEALRNNASIEILELMLQTIEKQKADIAKSEYNKAFAKFQSLCPVITKTKSGVVAKYAPLEEIITQIKPILAECGLTFSFETTTTEETVTAYCTITHIEGHAETKSFTAHHVIKNQAISLAQLDAGTATFAKRYALQNALGIVTQSEDTDAQKALATKEQIEEIIALGKLLGLSDVDILRRLKLGSFNDLDYIRAVNLINSLKKRVGE